LENFIGPANPWPRRGYRTQPLWGIGILRKPYLSAIQPRVSTQPPKEHRRLAHATLRGGLCRKTEAKFRRLLLFQKLVDIALVDDVGTGINHWGDLFPGGQVIQGVDNFYSNFVRTLADQHASVSFLQKG
jgi:hypothetical protein